MMYYPTVSSRNELISVIKYTLQDQFLEVVLHKKY